MTPAQGPVGGVRAVARPRPFRRLCALALTLALLVLASQINKLPEKLSSNYDTVALRVGQLGTLDTAEITITEVALTKQVQTSGPKVRGTTGTFVLLTGTITQPGPKKALTTTVLSSGGRTFRSSSVFLRADPGFEETNTIAFEVPTENLPGLTAKISPSGLVLGYDQELAVDLGLNPARIATLLDRGRTGLKLPEQSEVRGL